MTATLSPTAADQGLLRTALRLDAVASGALGVACAAGAAVLDDLLGLPAALLLGVGVFLVVYAAGLIGLAARRPIPRGGTWVVVLATPPGC